MAGLGQIERLPWPGLSARYVIRQGTLAGAGGNERDAPLPAVRLTTIGRLKSTQMSHSW
jgi:hypothetical protein